ncbi:ABC transporter substrate-binding protein [Bauldia sp.]|uniref:ABC transporter substrate-binding protein n=1 Tax=Bauldia sp. TaxID=2575872 RepID=UPI003BAAA48A
MTDRLYLPRRSVLKLMGAGVMSVGLPGAFANRAMAAMDPVGFQLSWLNSVQFGGSYLAEANGYWAAENLEVALTPGGPNAPVEPPVVSGAALMGISAADYTAAAVAEGANFKIIAVAMQKNPFTITSLPDNPVNTPKDLEGKSIGMATANTPVLQAVCTLNDVDINQIEIIPTQYDAAPLVNGEVDSLLSWLTDLPVAMTINGIDNVTMLLADYGYTVHSQTYIVLEDSLADNRDEVIRLMRGELKGWQTYKEDPAAAAKLTVEMFPDAGLDLPTQELQAAEQVHLMFSPLTDAHGFGWFTEETVAANIETLALLGRDVTPDLWDRSVLEEIYDGKSSL